MARPNIAHGSVGTLVLAALTAFAPLVGCGDDDSSFRQATVQGPTLLVGAAKRDISPSMLTAPPEGRVSLGGYGLGPGRRSTGVLAPIFARALVFSVADTVVVFAEEETQGAFAAYKRDAVGLTDIGAAVEAATDGQIPRSNIIVSSDHTHSGPDTTGVWGGLPATYLAFIKAQVVGVILDAFAARHPAQLLTGTANATALLHSQFDAPPNDQVDGELRVLVAADPDDATQRRALLINFAAHATVMGADNLLLSADWPGAVAARVEEMLGIATAVVMVADVGRTQPARPEAPGETNVEKLEAYATDVTARVLEANAHAAPVRPGTIAATQLFLRERYVNSFFSLALLSSFLARNSKAPWLDQGVIGTVVSAVRIGDLFFAAVPGEAYPAIQFALQSHVPAQQHFIFGLANDQLGYLISPQDGYPQVAAAAPDNDNALFNVSPAIGDHVMCTLFKAARRIGFALPADPATCTTYADEDNRLPF